MTQEFDEYVDRYAEQHRQSIRLSGEAPDFFAADRAGITLKAHMSSAPIGQRRHMRSSAGI